MWKRVLASTTAYGKAAEKPQRRTASPSKFPIFKPSWSYADVVVVVSFTCCRFLCAPPWEFEWGFACITVFHSALRPAIFLEVHTGHVSEAGPDNKFTTSVSEALYSNF